MGKKDDTELAKVVEDLIRDNLDDRDRLVEFLDGLISEYDGQRAGIAEYVAKIADALTKQQQIRVATLKTLSKRMDEADDDDDFSHEIGPAFEEDLDEDSN